MLDIVPTFARIGEENAFAVLARATELARQGKDIINLGIGQPDFPTPPHIVEAAIKALRDGHHGYTPATGILPLREAVAADLHSRYGAEVSPERVMIVPGGKVTMFMAILMFGQPGVEILYPDPGFPIYRSMIEFTGATPVPVPIREENGFAFSAEETLSLITPRTRLLIVNTPHNPSSAMLDGADMQALADVLRGTGIYLVSDEVYEHIIYDGRSHESALRYPELRERAFVISSFGKTYHCTGWKIGYAIAPPALTAEFRKVHQYNTFTSFGPAQYGFAAMIRDEPEHHLELGAFYQAKRDRFREQLAGTRLKPLPVPGGYFQLVDYSAISDLPDHEFVKWLTIEKGVTAIPLSPFYENPPAGQRLVRLCFAKNEATLDAAIERLRLL